MFSSKKKTVILVIVGIIVMLVFIPIATVLINLAVDQLFFAEKRGEIRKRTETLMLFNLMKVELETYADKTGTFPRAEDGGLGALNLSYDPSLIFQYAYCLSDANKATHYHMGIKGVQQISTIQGLTEGANFNPVDSTLSLPSYAKCEGEWHLEDGTPGGFDGTEMYDVVCTRNLLCF